MELSAKEIVFQGENCIELQAGGYVALIAPGIGSNCIRLRDEAHGIEIFRFDPEDSIKKVKASPEVYGLPTLYLPNRLDHGVLKASDATYQLPINEPDLKNHIHGFLHKRAHTVVSVSTSDNQAIAKTAYVYDEKDEFFKYFPVSFKAEFTFILSAYGLEYDFTMTNTSEAKLPYGTCTHTTIMAPFTDGGSWEDVRLYAPVGEKWQLNERCIPNGVMMPFDNHDKQYLTGSMVPVKRIIDNDVFDAAEGDIDDQPIYGVVVTDLATKAEIRYEVCRDYKFWVFWNEWGEKGYFCPEPMTWMINAPNILLSPDDTGYAELAPGASKTVTQHIYTKVR